MKATGFDYKLIKTSGSFYDIGNCNNFLMTEGQEKLIPQIFAIVPGLAVS